MIRRLLDDKPEIGLYAIIAISIAAGIIGLFTTVPVVGVG